MKNLMAKAVPKSLLPSLSQILLDRIGEHLRVGTLDVELPDGTVLPYAGSEGWQPHVEWRLRNFKPLFALVASGATGFGESYVDGDWDTDSLVDLLYFAALNDQSIGRAAEGFNIARLAARAKHALRSNSRSQARRNIARHYDLGNAFYGLWLDESMTYSAGLFESGDDSLASAQRNKYASIAQLAGMADGDEVLEIGCGWGGFADYAIHEFDCTIAGVSISREQVSYAEQRLERSRYANRANIEFRDYRDLDGLYNRIVSIEMFEAVGEKYWDVYAQNLKRLLKHDGAAALQIITIDESRFDTYRSSPDFIQTHIFPGGMLPTRTILAETFARAGLEITAEITAGDHYARTLVMWRERFESAWPTIRELGFDDRFRRLWLFYLAYCEAGFKTGATDLVQLRLQHR